MKQIRLYGILLALVSLFIYYLHVHVFVSISDKSPVPLDVIYLFNGAFSLLTCSTVLYLSNQQKYNDQIGFLYLASVVLKLVLFFLIFYRPIFKTDAFTNTESVNLLIPIILFLIIEVILIRKLLNKNSHLKNES
ncbi:hypothetical protein EYD45_07695 [Hyunsoonleella flava]|uniref:Uncharacterized protein n=1 Tax=Hyunsoonleella flava TaxID=2527939 RepID=A0A4Q9FJK1_9FLAO|nr:DUF6168 family protein [Hyunsoonleella flava]TBN03897.1 hypothetical protein EYD45_07695 [Hyunsoonleella flava]